MRPAHKLALIGIVAAVAAASGLAAVVMPAGAGGLHLFSSSAPSFVDSSAATSSGAASVPAASASASAPAPAAPKPAGPCGRAVGTKPITKVTSVSLGSPVTGYGGEGDTEPLPMAIAATPRGGSWLAWLGTDGRVYLGKLDCNDKLVGTPTSFAGIDLQDVQADANGGVLLLTRQGDCGTGPLCGGESSPCNTMHMIRFDNSGHQVWERQVTNLTSAAAAATTTAPGSSGGTSTTAGSPRTASNYAAYFGVAITVQNGNCVDIHEGDRMQVVRRRGRWSAGTATASRWGAVTAGRRGSCGIRGPATS